MPIIFPPLTFYQRPSFQSCTSSLMPFFNGPPSLNSSLPFCEFNLFDSQQFPMFHNLFPTSEYILKITFLHKFKNTSHVSSFDILNIIIVVCIPLFNKVSCYCHPLFYLILHMLSPWIEGILDLHSEILEGIDPQNFLNSAFVMLIFWSLSNILEALSQ